MRNKISANTSIMCSLIITGCLAVLSFPASAANNEANTESQAEIKAAAKSLPKVETKDKIAIESTDGDFKWQPLGRVMADYIAIDEDKTQLQSGFELRRARL